MSGYLHGYSPEEQERLRFQSKFLEKTVYDGLDLSKVTRLVEIGCGTGAQTEILLRRYPQLQVDAIDISEAQIRTAKRNVTSQNVAFHVGKAEQLPFDDETYDCAFLCFFLEHVLDPIEVLREARRVVKPGGLVVCMEVFNSSFFLHPPKSFLEHYWAAFNSQQKTLGGDPDIGAKLGNLLTNVGFVDINVTAKVHHLDKRSEKERSAMIDYFTDLLLSANLPLSKEKLLEQMAEVKNDADSVFFYNGMQAIARKSLV